MVLQIKKCYHLQINLTGILTKFQKVPHIHNSYKGYFVISMLNFEKEDLWFLILNPIVIFFK